MRRFHVADALQPDRARTLVELGQRESLVFNYLCLRGVIIPAGSGRYYLDPIREQDFRRRRFQFVLIVLVFGLSAMAAALTLALFR
jgi:hypothetical protein